MMINMAFDFNNEPFLSATKTQHFYYNSLDRRHLEKELSDVKQEKLFLELKLESLQKEVETFKDSTHQQRLRALDLKYELREAGYFLDTMHMKYQNLHYIYQITSTNLVNIFCNSQIINIAHFTENCRI